MQLWYSIRTRNRKFHARSKQGSRYVQAVPIEGNKFKELVSGYTGGCGMFTMLSIAVAMRGSH